MRKYICQNCPKALFFGEIKDGTISKDCTRCGQRNVITVKNSEVVKHILGKKISKK